MATVHMIFQKLGTESFNLEQILIIAKQLMDSYSPDSLLYDNHSIGFEDDSPFLDESLQNSTKLAVLAEETNQKHIKYERTYWKKYKKHCTFANIATFGITMSVIYVLSKHVSG